MPAYANPLLQGNKALALQGGSDGWICMHASYGEAENGLLPCSQELAYAPGFQSQQGQKEQAKTDLD